MRLKVQFDDAKRFLYGGKALFVILKIKSKALSMLPLFPNDTLHNYKKLLFLTAVFLLSLLTSLLHFWQLGKIPKGFFIDESSIGYNAWCILKTGRDEYGKSYPVFFECFGNYQDAVMVYALVPLIKIFGLEKWVIRFPSALFHIISAISFFFLAKKYSSNKWVRLFAAFIFSLLPWIFPVSRSTMSGYTPMLFGIILGLYFLFESISKKTLIYAILAGMLCALAMYSHNCARPIMASLILCFIFSFNFLLFKRLKIFLIFAVSLAICLLPMVIAVANNPSSLTQRFSLICVWNESSGINETIFRILQRYIDYFSLDFLFITGDPIFRHNTGNSGELFIFLSPFIITGVIYTLKHFKKNPYLRFALLATVLYPIAAILTIDRMHSTRSINGSIFWLIIATSGTKSLFATSKNKKLISYLFYGTLVFGIIEITGYFRDYFGEYVQRSSGSFSASLCEALEFSFQKIEPNETLYVSYSVFPQRVDSNFKPFWYSHLLFFGKISPEIYLMHGIPKEIIQPYNETCDKNGILLKNKLVTWGNHKEIWIFENPEQVPEGSKLIAEFPISEKNAINIYKIIIKSGTVRDRSPAID